MADIHGARIMILATDGFEQSELEVPRDRLRDAGATVDVVSVKEGEIKGWDHDDWGTPVRVDRTLATVNTTSYDALVLPGGQINPDLLRTERDAVEFIRAFHETGKPVAAVCHAPWLLIEAGLARGRRLTSYKSIVTDLKNAGARWQDAPTVVDDNLITARNPGDLDSFSDAIKGAVEERLRQGVAAV